MPGPAPLDSGELASKEDGPETFRVFRAPAILEVGPDVQVLVDYPVPFKKFVGFRFLC